MVYYTATARSAEFISVYKLSDKIGLIKYQVSENSCNSDCCAITNSFFQHLLDYKQVHSRLRTCIQ